MPSEDAKTVKKEEVKEEDVIRVPSRRNATSIPKVHDNGEHSKSSLSRSKSTKVKNEAKEAENDSDDDDRKPISQRNSASNSQKELSDKKIKKKKVKEEENNVAASNQNGTKKVKREKKIYDLPGQKRDPPEERDPLRIFYETLYEQIPSSEMAQFWMMESGLLQKDIAKKIFEKKQKNHQKVVSPAKSVSAKRNPDSAGAKKTPSSQVSLSKKKTETSKNVRKPSKKLKNDDSSSENGSDDDFEVLSKTLAKKRKVS